jgi:hypothetical protein
MLQRCTPTPAHQQQHTSLTHIQKHLLPVVLFGCRWSSSVQNGQEWLRNYSRSSHQQASHSSSCYGLLALHAAEPLLHHMQQHRFLQRQKLLQQLQCWLQLLG